MKLGILQTDHVRDPLRSGHGDYDDMFMGLFAGQPIDVRIYNVLEDELPQAIDECDGYLITGSRYSAYDAEPWIQKLKAWVISAHQSRRKLIGICFGHQLIADALGGRVGKAETGWRVGVHPNVLSGSRRFTPADAKGVGADQFNLLFSHQDQVLEMPPGAELLASGTDCPCAMYAIDDHILCLQGHPEMNKVYVSDLLAMRRPAIGEDVADLGLASLATPTHQTLVARWLTSFLGATAVHVQAKVLLFDLDGTLVDREATMAAFLRRQWGEVPGLAVAGLSREAFVSAVLRYQDGGYADKATGYEEALNALGVGGSEISKLVPELVVHLDRFYGDPALLFPGVLSMLKDLSRRFRLALITNGNTACQQRKIDSSGIGPFFDVVTISQQVGLKKPASGIFHHCFDALGVKPEEVVMVGDHPDNDITGARKLGCMTVQVTRTRGDEVAHADQVIATISELPVALRRMSLIDG